MLNDYILEIGDIISFNSTSESRLVTFNGESIGKIETKRNTDNHWFVSKTIGEDAVKHIAAKVDDRLAKEVIAVQPNPGIYVLKMKYKSKYARNFICLAKLVYTEIQLQDLPF